MYRQKSIISHAASISAWNTDLDWPRTVAAFSVARHGPASRSAARRKTAARSSNDSARQPRAAAPAAAIAATTSSSVALPNSPRTRRKLCGWTTAHALAGPHDRPAADRHGQLGLLSGELLDLGLERGAVRAARLILAHRLVVRRWHSGHGIHGTDVTSAVRVS